MTLPAPFLGQASHPQAWRAPSPALLSRVDLSGLVESGAVTSVQVQPDGSLVLECPGGLPADLAGLVEPQTDEIEGRLSRIERSLERLSAELRDRERMGDRLDAVEFGLAEKLQGVIAEEVFNLFAEQEGAEVSVIERVDAILNRPEGPESGEILARLTELCARPMAMTPDLAPMRQMNSGMLQALQTVMLRLEGAIADLTGPALQDQLAALAAGLAPQPVTQPVDAIAAPLADLGEQIQALAGRIETLRPVGDLTDAVALLADRIAALEARPAPVVDLTEQRRSFAAFATAMGTALRRVETVSEALAERISAPEPASEGPDLAARINALGAAIAPPPDLGPVLSALSDLSERLTALENRPGPVLDLTEQRKSLAAFGTALGAALRRIDSVAERLEGSEPALPALVEAVTVLATTMEARISEVAPKVLAEVAEISEATTEKLAMRLSGLDKPETGGPDDRLAQAILSLAERMAPPPSSPDLAGFRAAQQDFFQDLRFLLAEIVAGHMRTQSKAV